METSRELLNELKLAQNKNSGIDLSSVANPESLQGKREMALLMEQKEKLEAIDKELLR